jgi:hypothetical protein
MILVQSAPTEHPLAEAGDPGRQAQAAVPTGYEKEREEAWRERTNVEKGDAKDLASVR